MRNQGLSSNQDTENGHESKPTHVHLHGSGFLDDKGGHTAFTTSSTINVLAGQHESSILTLEDRLREAYQACEM
jgi:hypothetical protein